MINDIIVFFLAFSLGYGLFIACIYFLVKWMLPKIDLNSDHRVSIQTIKS